MKNKKILYFLFPLVILIWGAIIYKIVTHLKDDKDFSFNSNVAIREMKPDSVIDSFTLIANYRDPFLRAFQPENGEYKKRGSVIPNHVRQTDLNKPVVNWPEIVYNGRIENAKDKSKVILMKINGKDYLVKQGDEIQGIKIITVYKDSLKLMYMKEYKSFIKTTMP